MKDWMHLTTRSFRLFCAGAVFWALAGLHDRFQLVMVDGRSMEPTYRSGHVLLIDKQAPRREGVHRDDVVVARFQGDLIVKRVVGLPGETVEVREGCVLVNGYPADPAYQQPGTMELRPGLMKADHFGLLGDNRSMNPGEHVHAVVAREAILGRVMLRLRLFP